MSNTVLQVVGSNQILIVKDPAFSPTIIQVQAQGPAGPVGPVGQGLNLIGSVATVGNLPGSGSSGAAYLVTANNHIYVWST